MERHTVALLVLVAVIAAAFPVLYQARAHDQLVVVYQYVVAVPDRTHEEPVTVAYQWVPKVSAEENVSESVVPEDVSEAAPTKKAQETIQTTKVATEAQKVSEVLKSATKKPVVTDFAQELRSQLHTRTNAIRVAKGLPTLVYDTDLASIAAGHSADMRNRDYLAHVSPEGCDVTCRVNNAGYQAHYWGENIIWIEATTLPDVAEMAASFMESWMNSGGHRENILSANYTHAGIGVASAGGVVYVTVNFAQPK